MTSLLLSSDASPGPNDAPTNAVDPRVTVYRVVDPTELAYVQAMGNYGANRARSGKYFALTAAGARAFADGPINAGSTITRTTLPRSVINQAFRFNDPGQWGAGPSIFFGELQLPAVYSVMTPPVVVASARQQP